MSQPSKRDPLTDLLLQYAPALAASVAAIVTSVYIIFDDIGDFGKLDRPTHHVYTGFLPLIAGLAGLGFTVADMVKQYPSMQKNATVKNTQQQAQAQTQTQTQTQSQPQPQARPQAPESFTQKEYAPELLAMLK